MNKKVKVILILFITVIGFSIINVEAETPLPYKGTAQNIGYEIEGFQINIYNPEELLEAIEEDAKPIATIDIPAEEITINPTEQFINNESLTSFGPTIAIKLNLTNHTALFERLVKEKMASVEAKNDESIAILNVKYKLTSIPSQYKYKYRYGINNLAETINAIFNQGTLPTYTESTSTLQAITTSLYKKSTSEFNYNTAYEKKEQTSLGESFSSIEITGTAAPLGEFLLLGTEDIRNSYKINNFTNFLMHDNADFESEMKKAQEEYDSDNDFWDNLDFDLNDVNSGWKNNYDTKQVQTIKVPDTKANATAKMLIGISIMLLGSAIVIFELRKKVN